MARALELRRHTANDGDVLSPQGVAAARAIGERLTGPYELLISSGAQRATQTLACMLGAMPPQPGAVEVDARFRSEGEDAWRAAYAEAGGGDIGSFLRVAPDLVASESRRFAEAARAVLDRLGDGGRALVIGHSPMHEATVYGLTGEVVEALAKGAALVVTDPGDGTYQVDRIP
jgi:broad specificity phosphatase PhoE